MSTNCNTMPQRCLIKKIAAIAVSSQHKIADVEEGPHSVQIKKYIEYYQKCITYKNSPLFVEKLPPVPARPPPSTPEDCQEYETPVPFDPFPGVIRRASADSDQYAIYSRIENEDQIAEDDYNVQSNVTSNPGVGLDTNEYLVIIEDLNQD